MAVTKPAQVRWFLSWLNPSLEIPPFNVKVGPWTIASQGSWLTLRLPIGDTIETALGWTLDVINAAIGEIWGVIQNLPSIPGILAGVFQIIRDQVAGVYQYILNFAQGMWVAIYGLFADVRREFTGAIGSAYNNLIPLIRLAKREVMDWTPGFVAAAIAAAILPFRWHFNLLTEFGQDIIDLFKDPEEWLLDKIESMLVRFL